MRLFLLCLTALIAFAANSLLNRAALSGSEIGPAAFQAIRLISGALMLAALVMVRRPAALAVRPDPKGVASLLLYMVGFSYAYVSLQTGTGALILFGGVQVVMFAGAILSGETLPARRWIGTGLGLAGLAILFLPGATAPSPTGAGLMIAAAVGWGIYSLLGKTSDAPLEQTARNFIYAAPIGCLIWGLAPMEMSANSTGVTLAIASGALASGVGYAIWYAVLPKLEASVAAIAQLTVPLIALAGGAAFLGEPLTLRFAIAAILILGGVVLAIMRSGSR